jgi:hypothetical protein
MPGHSRDPHPAFDSARSRAGCLLMLGCTVVSFLSGMLFLMPQWLAAPYYQASIDWRMPLELGLGGLLVGALIAVIAGLH